VFCPRGILIIHRQHAQVEVHSLIGSILEQA
jgi:hypothetical protein